MYLKPTNIVKIKKTAKQKNTFRNKICQVYNEVTAIVIDSVDA